MSKDRDKKKNDQLGMSHGTAANRLRKNILFNLLVKHNENVCFQCNELITTPRELSIEHKIPWLDNSVKLFWDLDNIAFSHLSCNSAAARTRDTSPRGSARTYNKGCRCKLCTKANTNKCLKYKKNRKALHL